MGSSSQKVMRYHSVHSVVITQFIPGGIYCFELSAAFNTIVRVRYERSSCCMMACLSCVLCSLLSFVLLHV